MGNGIFYVFSVNHGKSVLKFFVKFSLIAFLYIQQIKIMRTLGYIEKFN